MRTLKAVLFFLALVSGIALGSQRIYMPFFELINVHPDYQYSTAIAQPIDSIRAQAIAQDCPFYLLGDMNRMGETVILNVALYDSKSGDRIWGDRLKAANPEDLDPIFQRLAKAIGTGNKATSQGDIYSVTDYENRELKKIQVHHSFGLALDGPLMILPVRNPRGRA
jgi:hypothetical protein